MYSMGLAKNDGVFLANLNTIVEIAMKNEYILEMNDICKTFPGAKVLANIDLKVRAGEVRALIGENGAGKSTLIKILGGIYQRDKNTGTIKIDGGVVIIDSVQDAKKNGISIIHQEISLADNMSVADNLFMGCELLNTAKVFLNDKEMIKRAQKIIDELGIDVDAHAKIADLSIAKQQMVEICRALLTHARIIVMDEPTSSLTNTEIEQLFIQIDKLKNAGIAIIYISHRMDEIFKISDSITVLRDGQLIGTDNADQFTQDKIIKMMVGRELSEIYKKDGQITPGEDCLIVNNFCNKKLKDVSFSLRKGEILGFAGLVGAGRTELASAIFGVDKLDSGELFINGKRVVIRNAKMAIENGIAYVPESRKTEGLFLLNTIKFNLTITILEQFMKFANVNRKKEKEIVDRYANRLAIKMTSTDQKVQYLSGGNQQKVVVSKWLATNPDILILDEPTRGIDIGAKSEIYHLIYELAKNGVAVMLISSEMEEIINLSTRVIIMYEGKINGIISEVEMKEITQEKIMMAASGGTIHGKK